MAKKPILDANPRPVNMIEVPIDIIEALLVSVSNHDKKTTDFNVGLIEALAIEQMPEKFKHTYKAR
jgi:hypothetical protein